MQPVTADIGQRYRNRQFDAQRLDGQRHGMQQLRIAAEHVGDVHLLHAHAFDGAGEPRTETQYAQLVRAFDVRIRHEVRDDVRVIHTGIRGDRTHGDRHVAKRAVATHQPQRPIDAFRRADDHSRIFALAAAAVVVQQTPHHPAGDQFAHQSDQRCDDQRGARQLQVQHECHAARQHDCENRGVDELGVQLISLGHHMPVVRAGERQTQ